MGKPKQVILIRRDLKMRRGKEIAQGSHAAMDFLIQRIRSALAAPQSEVSIRLNELEKSWIASGMAKVCLQVNSEPELLELAQRAINAGLQAYIIKDSGRTEFGGVPTITSLAIGPADSDAIDEITGHLALY